MAMIMKISLRVKCTMQKNPKNRLYFLCANKNLNFSLFILK